MKYHLRGNEEYNWNPNWLNANVSLETKYQIRASSTGTYNASCWNGASWVNIYGDKGTKAPYIITVNKPIPSSCLIAGQPLKLMNRIVGGPGMAPTFYYESRVWYYSS